MSHKLDELTPEIYLRYKRTKLHDIQIARLYDCSEETLTAWKRKNGLFGVRSNKWDTRKKYFPDEIEKMKKKFIELYNKGWKQEAIAEELGMSRPSLSLFIKRFLPQYKAFEIKMKLTKEQKEIIQKHGLTANTVLHRIRAGWPIERALTQPARRKNKKRKDVS
ncbi:helix-turn-helix domain-containing protein [Bacillus sp. FSL W8-0223]|uniref:helix-turn-helix domain-containing protein n=1 Tax=Bacillus sp. FSL W8-0223 TaxID=2954595 RepID=UPI0030F969A0